MEALYSNDALRGRGYGRFRITGLSLPLPDGVTYALQRSSDGRYLGMTDWQDAAEQLHPDTILPDADGVIFAVSPQVVNQLDEQENYRFYVYMGGDSIRCPLMVSGVLYADMDSGSMVPDIPPDMPGTNVPKVTPPPVPEPVPQDAEPVQSEMAMPPQSLSFGATPPPRKSYVIPVVILTILALALIGTGVYFLYGKGDEDPLPVSEATPPATPVEPVIPVEPAPPAEPQTPPAKPEPSPAPPAQTPPAPAALTSMEQARGFLRGRGAADEAVKLGRSLPQASAEDQDAVFLLMEVAAEGGNTEAMLEVARFYNPADTSPSGTVIKDAEQAAMWYKKAAANQATASAAAHGIESLKGWLQQEAGKGSSSAKELLGRL